jgi:hypothetical protein
LVAVVVVAAAGCVEEQPGMAKCPPHEWYVVDYWTMEGCTPVHIVYDLCIKCGATRPHQE